MRSVCAIGLFAEELRFKHLASWSTRPTVRYEEGMGLKRDGPGATAEQNAEIVAALSEPMRATIREIAEEAGVGKELVAHLLKKLQREGSWLLH